MHPTNFLSQYTLLFAVATGFGTLVISIGVILTTIANRQTHEPLRLDTAQSRITVLLFFVALPFIYKYYKTPYCWQFITFAIVASVNMVIIAVSILQLFLDISEKKRTYTAYRNQESISHGEMKTDWATTPAPLDLGGTTENPVEKSELQTAS